MGKSSRHVGTIGSYGSNGAWSQRSHGLGLPGIHRHEAFGAPVFHEDCHVSATCATTYRRPNASGAYALAPVDVLWAGRVPSTVMVALMSRAFVAALERFVEREGLDLVTFKKGQRKEDVAKEQLARFDGEEGCCSSGRPDAGCRNRPRKASLGPA